MLPKDASVTYVDSAGLVELVGLYTTAANRGSRLKLLDLQHRMRNLMVFEDEKEALSSFDASEQGH